MIGPLIQFKGITVELLVIKTPNSLKDIPDLCKIKRRVIVFQRDIPISKIDS